MVLSHVRLGLPGGRFQSDGGLWIAAATARWWSSSGALCAIWPKNLKRRSIAMLESNPDTDLTSAFLIWSCREPMYQMHLSGHTSTLLWPKFHANTSGLELYMSYTVVSWYLACRVWLPDPFSSRFMQVQAMPIFSVPRLWCYQRTQSCFPDRQMSQPLQLVHLPPGLLRIMMSYQTEGSWFWINLSEDKRSCFFLYNCQSKDKHFQYFCQ